MSRERANHCRSKTQKVGLLVTILYYDLKVLFEGMSYIYYQFIQSIYIEFALAPLVRF